MFNVWDNKKLKIFQDIVDEYFRFDDYEKAKIKVKNLKSTLNKLDSYDDCESIKLIENEIKELVEEYGIIEYEGVEKNG